METNIRNAWQMFCKVKKPKKVIPNPLVEYGKRELEVNS